MPEKKIMVLPAELVKKIDENRGDMSQADFIEFLIDSQLQPKDKPKAQQYATKEDIKSLEVDIKKLLKSFVDFFVSYGLELGKHPEGNEFQELTSKLHELEDHETTEPGEKEARIKWK